MNDVERYHRFERPALKAAAEDAMRFNASKLEHERLHIAQSVQCWFMNDDAVWEMGEILTWSVSSECDGIDVCLRPVAIVRCAGGRVRAFYEFEIRLEEPEDWSEPNAALTEAAERHKRAGCPTELDRFRVDYEEKP